MMWNSNLATYSIICGKHKNSMAFKSCLGSSDNITQLLTQNLQDQHPSEPFYCLGVLVPGDLLSGRTQFIASYCIPNEEATILVYENINFVFIYKRVETLQVRKSDRDEGLGLIYLTPYLLDPFVILYLEPHLVLLLLGWGGVGPGYPHCWVLVDCSQNLTTSPDWPPVLRGLKLCHTIIITPMCSSPSSQLTSFTLSPCLQSLTDESVKRSICNICIKGAPEGKCQILIHAWHPWRLEGYFFNSYYTGV